MTTRINVSFWIDCASFREPTEHDLLSLVIADDKLGAIIADVAEFVVGKLKENHSVYVAGIDNITLRPISGDMSRSETEKTEIHENSENHKWIKKRIETFDGKSSNLWWQCEKCRSTPTLVAENRPNENMPDLLITVCKGYLGSERSKFPT